MDANNGEIARRVYRALKTPSDDSPRTDPILAFHFKGRDDYIMMRCNKTPEISIKGKDQTAGEVKFFAYSDFADYSEDEALFKRDFGLFYLENFPGLRVLDYGFLWRAVTGLDNMTWQVFEKTEG